MKTGKATTGVGRRVLRALIFALVLGVTVIGLAYSGCGLWGRLEWSKSKKELLAKGEPLSLTELMPPEIPDRDNFYATKSWRDLELLSAQLNGKKITLKEFEQRDPFGALYLHPPGKEKKALVTLAKRGGNLYRGDRLTELDGFAKAFQENHLVDKSGGSSAMMVLEGLKGTEPIMSEMLEAALRPLGRYPYKLDPEKAFEVPLEHITPHFNMAQLLQLRAVARMAAGDAHGAASDVLLILRIGEALQADPFLISKLVQMSCMSLAIAAFWECNALGTWDEGDLRQIQHALMNCYPMEDMILGLRCERGIFNEWLGRPPSRAEFIRIFQLIEQMGPNDSAKAKVPTVVLRFYPWGLILGDQAKRNFSLQEIIDELKNKDVAAMMKWDGENAPPGPRSWWHLMSEQNVNLHGMTLKALSVQSQLDLAGVACALERYRLKKGVFPATLDALVPDFIAKVPIDPMTRAPVVYQLSAADNYKITCSAVKSASANANPPTGKWVWNRRPEIK